MELLFQIPTFTCASVYVFSDSDDELMVPIIIGLITMLALSLIFFLVARNYAKNRQNKDQDKPLQALQRARVVEKKSSESAYAPTTYTFDLHENGRVILLAYKPELQKLVLGDIVDLSYRGETMESYQFSSQNEGQP